MPRPDFDPTGRLRVLGYDYEIRACASDDIPTNDGTQHMGRALIRVDADNAPDHVAQVALHEIVHAIEVAQSCDLKESQVHRVARGLYAVCRDNPDYMRRLLFPAEAPTLRVGKATISAEDAARAVDAVGL